MTVCERVTGSDEPIENDQPTAALCSFLTRFSPLFRSTLILHRACQISSRFSDIFYFVESVCISLPAFLAHYVAVSGWWWMDGLSQQCGWSSRLWFSKRILNLLLSNSNPNSLCLCPLLTQKQGVVQFSSKQATQIDNDSVSATIHVSTFTCVSTSHNL